jgi:hypothetical protein
MDKYVRVKKEADEIKENEVRAACSRRSAQQQCQPEQPEQ